MFGYDPAEMQGSDASAVIHPEDFVRIHPYFTGVGPDRPNLVLTFRMSRRDGVYIWVEGRYRYLPEDGGTVTVLRDITARKEAEDALADAFKQLEAANCLLQALALKDGLTGLINRRGFDEALDAELSRARRDELPVSVLLLDVDYFKPYNDRYGHLAGDDCLRKVGRCLENVLQRPGDQAARYGGEEFVLLLPATDQSSGMLVAERIRAAIAALGIPHLDSPFALVTISIGVCSVVPLHQEDLAEGVLGAADRALYQAKRAGRNRVVAARMREASSALHAEAGTP